MTKEQLIHYLDGGIFTATYSPIVKHDLPTANIILDGQTIRVSQNMMINPLITPIEYQGQHAFDGEQIYGWIPEQDLKDLVILDEFLEHCQDMPQFLYKLIYMKKDQLMANFGVGDYKVPMTVSREFSYENDKYILGLSKPQASMILKAMWNGEPFDEIKWEIIL